MQRRLDKNNKTTSQRQTTNLDKDLVKSVQFKDDRQEATAQQNTKENIANAVQTKQLKTLQLAANEYTSQLPQPIEKKENNTGLPDALKTGIENLSGYSMDDVKVHYNSPKPAQLQAHAYAQGSTIHLASGQEKHLPHEAWHVVQQKQGRVQPTLQLKNGIPVNDNKGLESEADTMGAQALHTNAPIKPVETHVNGIVIPAKGPVQRMQIIIGASDNSAIKTANKLSRFGTALNARAASSNIPTRRIFFHIYKSKLEQLIAAGPEMYEHCPEDLSPSYFLYLLLKIKSKGARIGLNGILHTLKGRDAWNEEMIEGLRHTETVLQNEIQQQLPADQEKEEKAIKPEQLEAILNDDTIFILGHGSGFTIEGLSPKQLFLKLLKLGFGAREKPVHIKLNSCWSSATAIEGESYASRLEKIVHDYGIKATVTGFGVPVKVNKTSGKFEPGLADHEKRVSNFNEIARLLRLIELKGDGVHNIDIQKYLKMLNQLRPHIAKLESMEKKFVQRSKNPLTGQAKRMSKTKNNIVKFYSRRLLLSSLITKLRITLIRNLSYLTQGMEPDSSMSNKERDARKKEDPAFLLDALIGKWKYENEVLVPLLEIEESENPVML